MAAPPAESMSGTSRREVLIGGAAAAAFASALMPEAAAKTGSMSTSEWDYRTATELTAALRARKISASELLHLTIRRVEAADRSINAVVVRDFERAREAAKAADAALARGESGPLLGVPVTVKESFNVAGLPTTWGYSEFRTFKPEEDALAVSRLKRAGAVIFGKTNVPSGLSDWQSYNGIYGTTNNPWDVHRTPGGSSGGSAAAIFAGFGPLSLGSDMGGSLRAPAHYCGAFAHKPTLGLVPRRGQVPPGVPPLPLENGLAVVGPLSRAAADLALALDVIAGPDEEREGIGYRLALPAPRHDDLKSFRVLVLDTHPLGPTANAMKAALCGLADHLLQRGVRVARGSPLLPDLSESVRLYTRLLSSLWGERLPPDYYAKLEEEAKALSPDDRSLAAERSRGAVISHRDWLAADRMRLELRERWRELSAIGMWCSARRRPAPPSGTIIPSRSRSRHIEIDGKSYPYLDAQLVWAEIATTPGLPATSLRSTAQRMDCPSACR